MDKDYIKKQLIFERQMKQAYEEKGKLQHVKFYEYSIKKLEKALLELQKGDSKK